MALTAREWLLLPQEEAELRKSELSAEECAKLRLELDMIHFTEDENARCPQSRSTNLYTLKKERLKKKLTLIKKLLKYSE